MLATSLAPLAIDQRFQPRPILEYRPPHTHQPGVALPSVHAMALPSIPRLSQSKSKGEFFERLGWDENDERHKRLYQMMMEEAAAGRARTVQDRNNLTPQTRDDPRVGDGPYSSAMITETARYREIQSIYNAASPETKWWYDRGITSDSGWDNWIIRWCLWHVFRYRDDRNRNRRSPQRNQEASSRTNLAWSPAQSSSQTQASWQPSYNNQPAAAAEVRTRYDPVYDRTSYETVHPQ
ncbi:hypothetical protein, variant [Verruconis gallopava]|uniref:Uncharacterized protein n=1 Tax=Verruconis gallopava TaxID=253628 RepID=A0A0D1XJD4_9PEZI|nr:hypothetical protein, variant [Verruconis gallopava]KIW02411.1 hypothetical protein, variant [Verruconis gallopava]